MKLAHERIVLLEIAEATNSVSKKAPGVSRGFFVIRMLTTPVVQFVDKRRRARDNEISGEYFFALLHEYQLYFTQKTPSTV